MIDDHAERRRQLVAEARRMHAPELRATARHTAILRIGEAVRALDAAADVAGEAPSHEGRAVDDARVLLAAAHSRLQSANAVARRSAGG